MRKYRIDKNLRPILFTLGYFSHFVLEITVNNTVNIIINNYLYYLFLTILLI